ncbi:MAG: C40 family peptidase [Gemmatimonadaceae bacterium]
MQSYLTIGRAALLVLPLAACSQQYGGPVQQGRPTPVSTTSAAAVLPTAHDFVGVKYVWGGESPRTGFDCSGFTQYVFARHGVRIPRTSRAQVAAGQQVQVGLSSLRPGDLIMFANPGKPISHVAIYAGNRQIIHSSSTGGGVRYEDLSSRRGAWYRNNMVAVRRIGETAVAGDFDANSDFGDFMIRDYLKELRKRGVRVDFPPDLGDFAPPVSRRR